MALFACFFIRFYHFFTYNAWKDIMKGEKPNMKTNLEQICQDVLDIYPPAFLKDDRIMKGIKNTDYVIALMLRILWRHYAGLEPDEPDDLHRFAGGFTEPQHSGLEEEWELLVIKEK